MTKVDFSLARTVLIHVIFQTSVRATTVNGKTRTRETTKHKTDQEDGAASQRNDDNGKADDNDNDNGCSLHCHQDVGKESEEVPHLLEWSRSYRVNFWFREAAGGGYGQGVSQQG